MKPIVKKLSMIPVLLSASQGSLRKRAMSTIVPNMMGGNLFGTYKNALMRKIDLSLPEKAIRLSDSKIDIQLAIDQHNNLSKALESTGVSINELPSDNLADSVFVEDTVIIVGNIAMITFPGAPSRRPETDRIKRTLEHSYTDIKVVEQFEGTLDGGDVLFTGGR